MKNGKCLFKDLILKKSPYFSGVMALWKFRHFKLVSNLSKKLFELGAWNFGSADRRWWVDYLITVGRHKGIWSSETSVRRFWSSSGGARWLSGRVSDSGARGPGFETYLLRVCPWARHFTPRKYWLITQEAMAPSRHDWKIVDRDVKPQHNQLIVLVWDSGRPLGWKMISVSSKI